MVKESSSVSGRYLVAIGCAMATLALRWLLDPLLGDALPLVTLYAGIIVAAWYGGTGPALLATLLGYFGANFLFIEPRGSFTFADLAEVVGAGAYALTSCAIAFLGSAMWQARRRAEASMRAEGARRAELEREIEERQRAEAARREREEWFEVTLGSVGDAVIATDKESRVIFMNPVAEALTGWTRAEASGASLAKVFPIANEYTREPVENPVARVLRDGTVVGLANHTILLARDGSERPIDDSAAPIRGADGTIQGVVLVFRDVSERRLADATREELAAIVESTGDAVIGKSLDGRITSWNRGAERLYGYRAEEVLGRSMSLLVPAGEENSYPKLIERLQNGATTERYEARRRRKDGTQIEVSATASPIRDPAGQLVGVSVVARDITEQRWAEALLRESQERLHLAMAGGQMGAWTRELDGTDRTDWSPELEAIFGLSPGEFAGTEAAFFEFVLPEDRERLTRAVVGAIENRTDYEIEFRFSPKGGGLRWMIGRGRATYDEEGRPVRLAGIGVDITERKRAEEALQFLADASTALSALDDPDTTLRRLVRLAVPFFADLCGIDLVDDAGTIRRVASTHADPAGAELLRQVEERYPVRWEDAATPARVIRSGQPALISDVLPSYLEQVAQDAEHLEILRALDFRSILSVPLLGRDRVLGALSFAAAASRRRYGAADLAVAEDLARRTATALENARLYQEAREADRRKDEFLAMLAHELRNPLAPIRNAVALLALGGPTDPRLSRAREIIDRQVTHQARLLDDLLDVSRVARGMISLRRERLDLAAVVRETAEDSRGLFEAAEVRFQAALPEGPIGIEGDRTRIAQVVGNLLQNAAKFTDRGGEVLLSLTTEGREAVITVRDTGIGIEPEMLPWLFETFTQADRSLARSRGGLGLGLALVKGLVELHGGQVRAASAGAGQGAVFTVTLPMSALPESAPAPIAPAGPVRARRVLIIEDHGDAAHSMRDLLEAFGHTVRVACTGPEGVAAAREFAPEVVLCDLGLPGMSGFEVAAQLRQAPEFARTRLIALSGYGQDEDRRRAREAGFDRHLTKPVEIGTLQPLLDEPSTGEAGRTQDDSAAMTKRIEPQRHKGHQE
jgi:PAS domain S-box-containing protein